MWDYHQQSLPGDLLPRKERCHSILNEKSRTTQSGEEHYKFREGFIDWASNITGKARDIAYERLWEGHDPSFKVWANLTSPHTHSSPIAWLFVNMLPDTYNAYCEKSAKATRFQTEFTPQQGCTARQLGKLDHPVLGIPWCGHWNAKAVIGIIDCGIVENGQSHVNTAWSIYSKYGIISAKDVHNHQGATSMKTLRSKLLPNAPVVFLDELAVAGYAEYVQASGHFANEVLPKLLFLDKYLPARIPLLWPNTATNKIAKAYQELMRDHGYLSTTRRFIPLPTTSDGLSVLPKTYVAKRLYFVTTEQRAGEPLCLWALQRLVQSAWAAFATRMDSNTSGGGEKKIIVLKRGHGKGSRSLSNHNQLVAALRNLTGNSRTTGVEEFEIGGEHGLSLAEAGKRLSKGKVFIAPHGGGLNNMFMLPSNATIVEIGYLSSAGSFAWPPDYLCLARNLGLQYYASLATEGNHDSPLKANVPEILEIVRRVLDSLSR